MSVEWAQGEVVVVRYADDTVLGFQYQADADRFLGNLRERLSMFGLEVQTQSHLLSAPLGTRHN